MDELSSEPTRQRPSVSLFSVPGGAFLYGRLLSGVGRGVRKVLEKAHCIEEPIGRQRKEPSAETRLMVNV